VNCSGCAGSGPGRRCGLAHGASGRPAPVHAPAHASGEPDPYDPRENEAQQRHRAVITGVLTPRNKSRMHMMQPRTDILVSPSLPGLGFCRRPPGCRPILHPLYGRRTRSSPPTASCRPSGRPLPCVFVRGVAMASLRPPASPCSGGRGLRSHGPSSRKRPHCCRLVAFSPALSGCR
jgi:hypothetical protein